MLRLITIVLIIGLIYRVLTRFIFPVMNITSAASDHLKKMQDQMNEMNKNNAAPVQRKAVKKEGDYIDYEEVK
jgi:fructose-specific phosphotransferase system IIC component